MLKITFIVVSVLFLNSCQFETKRESDPGSATPTQLVDAKYSLTKDRSEFDKLRESIPVEVKKTNDEKALMAELMGELKYPPDVVRDKFTTLAHKKRDLFNKDMTRLREDYNKNEKKTREEFLKRQEEERKEFLSQKVDRDRRADFFNDQDETRRTYFAEQRDKREEFESDVREKRKNFEDYLREKNDEFNAEWKEYSVRWREKQKQKEN